MFPDSPKIFSIKIPDSPEIFLSIFPGFPEISRNPAHYDGLSWYLMVA